MSDELITEARWRAAELAVKPNTGYGWATEEELMSMLANDLEATEARVKELEAGIEWQYSYFEKWADGSGVYERVTFRTLAEARKYFDNSGDMSDWNAEVKKKDRLVAGVEKRRVVEPGPWVTVESEGTDD